MTETRKLTPELVAAQENVAEAEHVLAATTPLLVDRLLIATGGDTELVKNLMEDIANLAGQAGTLAVAKRRESAVRYQSEHKELHPDNLGLRQESILFGQGGAQPIVSALNKIQDRAELVAKGESPAQRSLRK